MPRDDFSRRTLDTLAKRVGVRCSNPGCRKLTTGPREACDHIINIGVAAHITAASVGGPRYDPHMTVEGRRSPANGIWLCQNCAKLVDNDPDHYTADLLLKWKRRSEQAALTEIEGGQAALTVDEAAEIELSYQKNNISQDRHDYTLQVSVAMGIPQTPSSWATPAPTGRSENGRMGRQ